MEHINGWEILKRLQQCKVYVKHFSHAGRQSMKGYLKHLSRQNLSHVILNIETKDLKSEKSSKAIA